MGRKREWKGKRKRGKDGHLDGEGSEDSVRDVDEDGRGGG